VRVLVIGNPAAGVGRGAARARALVHALESRGHAVEWFPTSAPGDARRRAGERERQVDCLVVAGGDGTLNEVVNGLADPRRTPIVPMALGTANMLARHLGLPDEPERLADVVEAGDERRIDLCRADGTRFLAVAGVGFDALVTQAIRRTRRGGLGYRGYVAPIAVTFWRYRPPRFWLRLDGGPRVDCAFALACKLPNYGGLLRVAPAARPDSGAIDVCWFRRARRRDLLRAALSALRGRLATLEGVETARATRVDVESEAPVAVELDGDYWGTTPVSIEVEPGVVPLRVPARAPRER
jgi:YegS/Rv2252/BmrU family lipid kinase